MIPYPLSACLFLYKQWLGLGTLDTWDCVTVTSSGVVTSKPRQADNYNINLYIKQNYDKTRDRIKDRCIELSSNETAG